MTAHYSSEYVYHAQMEPMNVTATVSPSGDSAEIWIGTQRSEEHTSELQSL